MTEPRLRSDGQEEGLADPVRFVDQRLGASALIKGTLRYVFPDHWSFLLGEIALYSFVILIATGTYLALFFVPSTAETVYHGSYVPLQGLQASDAFVSTVNLSFDVPAGLLIRQTHHWAADLFIAAIVIHMARVFFTGAFRKPRELNYMIGLTLLGLGLLEGFLGYSLPDDLLSGMGLVIAYGVSLSVPGVGGQLSTLLWDGRFPGSDNFWPRLFIGHVFIVPAILGVLIAIHLAQIIRQHHADFPGPGRKERNTVGTPLWVGYLLRSLGWFFAVAAVLVLMGGLLQINPIFQWGPYEPWRSTNGAQPDWYLGWLIGALRLVPPLEPRFFGHTWIPNPFWGGAVFPLVAFGVLYAWPWLEQRFITKDFRRHDLLDRPRDNPRRTAFGAAFFSWIFLVFFAGSSDRLLVSIGFSYVGQIWFWRVAVWIIPLLIGWFTLRLCRQLRATGQHPWRRWTGSTVRRNAAGGFDTISVPVGFTAPGTGDEDGEPPTLGTEPGEPSRTPSGGYR